MIHVNIRNKYSFNIDYTSLRSRSSIIGVWDDHDFGVNNGDYSFVGKHYMRDVFLDFIGEPYDSLRRLDKDRGIYQDYITYH